MRHDLVAEAVREFMQDGDDIIELAVFTKEEEREFWSRVQIHATTRKVK